MRSGLRRSIKRTYIIPSFWGVRRVASHHGGCGTLPGFEEDRSLPTSGHHCHASCFVAPRIGPTPILAWKSHASCTARAPSALVSTRLSPSHHRSYTRSNLVHDDLPSLLVALCCIGLSRRWVRQTRYRSRPVCGFRMCMKRR